MNRYDRYLKIISWARRRYTVNGRLFYMKNGKNTKYTRIEHSAARKYLNVVIN